MGRFALLYVILFLHVLDSSIANLSLVTIARDFHIELHQGQWIVTSFGIGTAIAVAMGAGLSSWAGEKTVFSYALLASALAALGCGYAGSFAEMVFFRIAHGLASGCIIVLGQRLVLDAVGPARRAFGLSMWTSAVSIAPVAGPLAAAAILEHLSWHWLFWMNVPVIALAMLLLGDGLRFTGAAWSARPRLAPFALLAVALVSLQVLTDAIFAPAGGAAAPWAAVALAASCALLARRAPRGEQGLFQWRLLANANFRLYTTIIITVNAVLMATMVCYPMWLQTGYGLSVTDVAWVVAAGGLIAGLLSPVLAKVKVPGLYPLMIAASLAVFALSCWLTVGVWPQSGMADLMLPRIVLGFGLALFSPATFMSLADLPEKDSTAAISLSMFLRMAFANLIVALGVRLSQLLGGHASESLLAQGYGSADGGVGADVAAMLAQLQLYADTSAMHDLFAGACVVFLLLMGLAWHAIRALAAARRAAAPAASPI
ncbi:MFS transporter [Pseudoduganella namucuonensis]|uniref:Major Facilitator Superfamily protein n=1 Tax=Pseudoduganella namucuonensis TaxID=1035707 RepID=A0A1I7LXQ3_9BURK|nr:MFS transporter [Pseudoduganella namucuonensis]SFV14429.1 Major Facilitator Superfamily protein [Pseudoduganella namucuonensis]